MRQGGTGGAAAGGDRGALTVLRVGGGEVGAGTVQACGVATVRRCYGRLAHGVSRKPGRS